MRSAIPFECASIVVPAPLISVVLCLGPQATGAPITTLLNHARQ